MYSFKRLGLLTAVAVICVLAGPAASGEMLVAWGLNPFGQWGDGTTGNSYMPVPVMSSGVWTWGHAPSGESGIGDKITMDDHTTPQLAGTEYSAIDANDVPALAIQGFIPEPATLVLLSAGAVALFARRWRAANQT